MDPEVTTFIFGAVTALAMTFAVLSLVLVTRYR
jgi:hypothetical protein